MNGIYKAIQNPNTLGALCLILAALLVVRYFLGRFKKPLWPTTVLLGMIACTVYLGLIHRPLTNFWSRGHWTTFHYFLGSKYFEELEYYRLYRYSLLADEETGINKTRKLKHIRHLENYRLMPRQRALDLARKERSLHFTDERWEEFKRDWVAMNRRSPKADWNRMLNDRGFNPPPFWNTIPGMVAQRVAVEDTFAFMLIRNFDLLFMFMALALTAVYCGIDVAFIVFCFVNLAGYNEGRQLGTYFQFIWLASMIVSMAFYRAEKIKLSAAFLAVSAGVAVFPVVLTAGICVAWLRKWISTRKLPTKETVFLVTFAVCCIFFLLIGLTQGRGVHTTREFIDNITMHVEHQKYDSNKFGLTRQMGVDLSRPFDEKGAKSRRPAEHKKNVWVHRALWALLMGLGLGVMIRKVDDDDWLVPAGMILIFALMVASRYYYLSLIVFLIPPPTKKWMGPATLAASWLFVTHSFFPFFMERALHWRATFTAVNFGYLAFFLAFPVYMLIRQYRIDKQALCAPDTTPEIIEPAESSF